MQAIYFGADSLYLHQFSGFSRLRYHDDATWLLQNAGLSIRPMIDIARFIVDRINGQMTAVGHMRKPLLYSRWSLAVSTGLREFDR